MTTAQGLMLVLVTLVFFFFVKNLFQLLFNMEHDDIHKKRMKELNFDGIRIGESSDQETKAFLGKVTEPVVKYILPKIKYADSERLQRDLVFVGWDKFMNASQFRALDVILKAIGVIAFLVLARVQVVIAAVWFVIPFFGLSFFLKNSVTNKKDKMFGEFPEFIRLTQGYLVAEMTLVDAIENTIDFVGDEWQPYLKRFAINARIKSVRDALQIMQDEIDIFEVKELFSLIRVSLDQGIDIKESFESQTDKVRGMQLEVVMKKIEKRKMMGIILQGPLLLTIIIAFALPTLESMTSLG